MRLCVISLGTILAAAVAFPQELARGVQLYGERKYTDAEKELRATVKAEPENARGHYYLGLTLLELKKPAEAEGALSQADSLSSTAETKVALARALLEQRKFEQAEEQIRAAESRDATYAGILYERGRLHLAKQEYSNAVDDLAKFSEREPEDAYGHYYLAMAYNGAGRKDMALKHFDRFLRLRPDAPEAKRVRTLVQGVR
ncbi:MAG: tetratricopeptide repeat protein [Bryobacteraceae bacterium]|nr:tetratricopeptide repeat protein [Bryobacteraceae bacterium]